MSSQVSGTPTKLPKDDYLLSRGGLASVRLTTQHFVLNQRQGWTIHPQIEESLAKGKDVRICDLATGNGIWALNLAKIYTSATIVGLDISSEQFPPSFTLPKNVLFDHCNIVEPIPTKYQKSFDFVHIRLIVGAIYNKDKDLVISNIMSLLKPGGYLQWEEVKGNGLSVVTPSLEVDNSLKSFLERVEKITGFVSACRWTHELGDALLEKGFTEVQAYDPPINMGMLQHESDCIRWAIDELIKTIKGIPKPGAAEEMTQAAEELNRDYSTGEVWAYDWRVTTAQTAIPA